MKRRWSLLTQILIVLSVADVVLIWKLREPWQLNLDHAFEKAERERLYTHTQSTRLSLWPDRYSPDGTRHVGHYGNFAILIYEIRPDQQLEFVDNTLYQNLNGEFVPRPKELGLLCELRPGVHLTDDLCFWNNDIIAIGADRANSYWILNRRFPEWWWGHLYRSEVWAGVVISLAWLVLLVFRRREARRP